MRRGHFTALRPVCPRCRLADRISPLRLDRVLDEDNDNVVAGILHCDTPDCRLEFPIIDGIPIIVPDVATYISNTAAQLWRRHDLPEDLVSLIGDALGPGSEFDATRQHLGIYCHSHYGDGESPEADAADCLPRAIAATLKELQPGTPAIDLGCAVGGTTLALAERTGALTLGIDLNCAMLRVAQRVLHTGRLIYDRRVTGLVYERREMAISVRAPLNVDFWACDLLALPFADGAFQSALALNVLDCVAAPRALLTEVERLLGRGGACALASPYDWSPQATTAAAWIGGHSQRTKIRGASNHVLRSLLADGDNPQKISGLKLERNLPTLTWRLRLHERAVMTYESDALLLRRL